MNTTKQTAIKYMEKPWRKRKNNIKTILKLTKKGIPPRTHAVCPRRRRQRLLLDRGFPYVPNTTWIDASSLEIPLICARNALDYRIW